MILMCGRAGSKCDSFDFRHDRMFALDQPCPASRHYVQGLNLSPDDSEQKRTAARDANLQGDSMCSILLLQGRDGPGNLAQARDGKPYCIAFLCNTAP